MSDTAATPRMLRGDEAELFRQHELSLAAAVRHFVHGADDALVEDACSYAWLQLMRYQPERGDTLFAWLRTVAVREGWRLAQRERRDGHLELVPDWDVRLAADPLRDATDAREALSSLAALPEPQRICLQLFVSGHSYDDVTRLTGRSRTNVTKQLYRARRRLRQQRADDRS